MSIKIIDVPRMGYSACKPRRFDSYEILVPASLFAPMGNFANLRAAAVIS